MEECTSKHMVENNENDGTSKMFKFTNNTAVTQVVGLSLFINGFVKQYTNDSIV